VNSKEHDIFSTQVFMEIRDLEHLGHGWRARRDKRDRAVWPDMYPGHAQLGLDASMLVTFVSAGSY
jgi:hypothetical protein